MSKSYTPISALEYQIISQGLLSDVEYLIRALADGRELVEALEAMAANESSPLKDQLRLALKDRGFTARMAKTLRALARESQLESESTFLDILSEGVNNPFYDIKAALAIYQKTYQNLVTRHFSPDRAQAGEWRWIEPRRALTSLGVALLLLGGLLAMVKLRRK
jgi:hypothetical protein